MIVGLSCSPPTQEDHENIPRGRSVAGERSAGEKRHWDKLELTFRDNREVVVAMRANIINALLTGEQRRKEKQS